MSTTDTLGALELDSEELPSRCNAVTGKPYAGDILRLLGAELEQGWAHGAVWATYRQWAEVGRQVAKGERGTHGHRVVIVTDKRTGHERTTVRGFVVHHYAQTVPAGEHGPADDTAPASDEVTAEVGRLTVEDLRDLDEPTADELEVLEARRRHPSHWEA